jgi:YbbR domain-containing protein
VRALLRRVFLENGTLKAVAFILSVTLFIVVRGDRDAERDMPVAVAYVQPADRVLVSEVPNSIDVRVRGPWTRIKRLNPNDVDTIVVDLSKLGDGDFLLEDELVRLPPGLKVVSFKPGKLQLAFEHVKSVPVVPATSGQPAEGFAAEVKAAPAEITIRGPRRVIDGISEVRTLPISVSGRRTELTQEVALVALPRGVTPNATKVGVTVTFREELAARRLRRVPVIVRGATGGEANPATVLVNVTGPRHIIEGINDDEVRAVVELTSDLGTDERRRSHVHVQGVPDGVTASADPGEVEVIRPRLDSERAAPR